LSVGVIIQARMGSTRLPNKVLKLVGNLPLLGHVLGRLKLTKHQLSVVVATSDKVSDNVIEVFCKEAEVNCFRGDELDVLDRYYQCAQQYQFKHIVRLTADNPFTDIEELDSLIKLHLQDGNAFTHSFSQLPVGVGAEIFSFEALQDSWQNGQDPHHREHVDEYLIEHPEKFKTATLAVLEKKNRPDLRLTVDTEKDWEDANSLVLKSEGLWLTTEKIIELCTASA